jgi:hypothetical protein
MATGAGVADTVAPKLIAVSVGVGVGVEVVPGDDAGNTLIVVVAEAPVKSVVSVGVKVAESVWPFPTLRTVPAAGE